MTISIRTLLAQELDDKKHADLSWADVTNFITERYITNAAEVERRKMHLRREQLYRNEGGQYLRELIDSTFTSPSLRRKLYKWIEVSGWDNFLSRIVNEHSTVYKEPAIRTVGDDVDGTENQTYKVLQRLAKQHRKFLSMNRRLTLHRALLVGFRVRNNGTIEDERNEPVIDVVTPDRCFLIGHPTDPMHTIGVGIKIAVDYARGHGPAWVVWTEHEMFYLDEYGRMFGAPVEHEFGRYPYVFVSLEEGETTPWPGRIGEDLVSAHMSIWFANVSLIRELKATTKIQVLAGDTTSAVRQQAADSEGVTELPDGTSLSQHELGTDLEAFTSVARQISDVAASNNGMSGALMRHQGVQSAAARDLMRVPLREIRLGQQSPIRDFEADFVDLQLAVLAVDMPSLLFAIDGWKVAFADPQTPMSDKEKTELFEKKRRLTLDSTLRFMQRESPELTHEAAARELVDIVVDELFRNRAIRPLTDISGSPGAETPDGNSQQEPDSGQEQDAVDVQEAVAS